MSAAVDANLLIHASDTSSPRHERAVERVRRFATGPDLLYLFWPVVMAYLRVATHPAVFAQPLAPAVARANIANLLARPHVRCPGEQPGFWAVFDEMAGDDVIRGNLVPDAHLAALMRQHGVREMWTADRDFRRFSSVVVRDPFG